MSLLAFLSLHFLFHLLILSFFYSPLVPFFYSSSFSPPPAASSRISLFPFCLDFFTFFLFFLIPVPLLFNSLLFSFIIFPLMSLILPLRFVCWPSPLSQLFCLLFFQFSLIYFLYLFLLSCSCPPFLLSTFISFSFPSRHCWFCRLVSLLLLFLVLVLLPLLPPLCPFLFYCILVATIKLVLHFFVTAVLSSFSSST